MSFPSKDRLCLNLNRLAIVTLILVLLKVFTYFFQEFMPVFSDVFSKVVSAFLPFIIAFLIAFLLEPLVKQLMKSLRIRRTYASISALIISLFVVGLLVTLIVVRLYTELSELAISLPSYGYFVNVVNYLIDWAENFVQVNPQIQETITTSIQSLSNSLQGGAKAASIFLLDFIGAIPGIFIVLIIAIVATIFISSSFPTVTRYINNIFPPKWRLGAQKVSKDLGSAINGFIRAQVILISVTGVIYTVALLVMGNPYAFTLGVLSALLDLLPIVGTGIIYVPWAIGLFIVGSYAGGFKILGLWIFAMVVRQLLEPKIMGQSIGLDPLPTLISMYVGLQLLGVVGLFLGPSLIILYIAMKRAGIFDSKE